MSLKKKKSKSRLERQGSTASLTSIGSIGSNQGGRQMYLPEAKDSNFIDDVEQVKDRKHWVVAPMDTPSFKKIPQNVQKHEVIPEPVRNKKFNRHMDVLPHPRTRVEIPELEGDPTSGYFNANYVRGANGNPKAYICAMGPLPATIKTWWRMIWHNKVSCVIMATGLMEKNVKKCERYWPPRPGIKVKVVGMFVRTVKVDEFDGYVRTLMIMEHPSGEQRRLAHFWYNSWPDHGVPRTPDGKPDPRRILYMIRDAYKVESEINQGGPMVVHCSAGVGRSGTIIAIDICCQLLEATGKADLLGVVRAIRDDRVALVQHAQQYELAFSGIKMYAQLVQTDLDVSNDAQGAPTSFSHEQLVQNAQKKPEKKPEPTPAPVAMEQSAYETVDEPSKPPPSTAQYGVQQPIPDDQYGPVVSKSAPQDADNVYGAPVQTGTSQDADNVYGAPVKAEQKPPEPPVGYGTPLTIQDNEYGSVKEKEQAKQEDPSQYEYEKFQNTSAQPEYSEVPVAQTQDSYESLDPPKAPTQQPAQNGEELVYGDVMAHADALAQQMEAQLYGNTDEMTPVAPPPSTEQVDNLKDVFESRKDAHEEARMDLEAAERARKISDEQERIAREKREREEAERRKKERLSEVKQKLSEIITTSEELHAEIQAGQTRARDLQRSLGDAQIAVTRSETVTQMREEEVEASQRRLDREKVQESQIGDEKKIAFWASRTSHIQSVVSEQSELITSDGEKRELKVFRLCMDKAPEHKVAFLHADHPMVRLRERMCDTAGAEKADELDCLGISSTFACINA